MEVRGRDRAFTEFAAAVTPRLLRSAMLMCGHRQLAEDLVQTTLTQLYVAWRRVERSQSPEAYARTALLRAFLSHKRVRRNSEIPAEGLGADAASEHDPAAGVIVAEALSVLSPVDRAIVVLRYYEDRTVSETAAALGLSESAVRTRASRATAVLRAELTNNPEAQP